MKLFILTFKCLKVVLIEKASLNLKKRLYNEISQWNNWNFDRCNSIIPNFYKIFHIKIISSFLIFLCAI